MIKWNTVSGYNDLAACEAYLRDNLFPGNKRRLQQILRHLHSQGYR